MSNETAGEKTFAPTEKRLKDAASKGDVLRSKDLGTAAVMLVGAGWLAFGGPWLLGDMSSLLRESFNFDHGELTDFRPGRMLMQGLAASLPPILALAVPVILVTLASQLAFGRGRFVMKNLEFKHTRINPASGLKRMFGPNGLIEMGKGLLKITLLGGIAGLWWYYSWDSLLGLGRGNLSAQLSTAWWSVISLFVALCGGLIVIAAVDLPIQWVRRNKKLKMSHQEMKDEHKESEGSPEAKAQRRQRQRDVRHVRRVLRLRHGLAA